MSIDEHGPRRAALIALVLTTAAYFAAARLGFALIYPPLWASMFWAPNAILMVALLLTPRAMWWQLLVCVAVAHFAVELQQPDVPLAMAASWYITNVAEAVIGAVLVRRYVAGPLRMDRFRTLSLFLVLGALFAPALASFADAGLLTLNGMATTGYWDYWRHRFLANALATLVTVPTIFAWYHGPHSVRALSLRRLAEAAGLTAGLIIVTYLAFGRPPGPGTAPIMLFVPLPFIIAAGVRFGQRGVSSALLFLVLVSIWHALHGHGPFGNASPDFNALSIQLFFALVAVSFLSLIALLEERRHAEATERRTGEQLRLALDAAQMQTWDWSVAETQRWLAVSERALSDNSADIAILEGFGGAIHRADLAMVSHAISESMKTGATFQSEFRIIDAQGQIRWVLGRGRVLRNAAGQPVRMSGLTADISARKKAESLMAAENRILNMIATGASVDETLLEIACLIENEYQGLVCSIMLADPAGRNVRHIAAPSLPRDVVEIVNAESVAASGNPIARAIRFRRTVIAADLTKFIIWKEFGRIATSYGFHSCWATPILAEHGRVLGALAIYHQDATEPATDEVRLIEIARQLATIVLERRRAEMEAHEQHQATAHLARVAMLGELAGAYAHELAQPLTAMLSNAQAAQRLLNQSEPDLSEVREIMSDIISADVRASNVIQRLRPMLRKGQSQLALHDVNELMVETHRLARADLNAREVQLVTRPQPNLPPVLADRVQLLQVMLNLVINACDAMSGLPRGQRQVVMSTRCSADGKTVWLSVADRGTGIPPEMIEHIFQPFFTSKEKGLGLGLSICRSIAQAHTGRLWAVNNPERGATFHFTLPAAQNGDAPAHDQVATFMQPQALG